MSKSQEKLKAYKLRREGLSINAIAKKLKVSKGSVSLWCSEIVLTVEQKKVIKERMIEAGHKGRLIGAEINKNKKKKIIQESIVEASRMFNKLTEREMLIAGTALFWAEGTKKGSKLTFSNSDPLMILFIYKWYKNILGVKNDEFMPRIFINHIHKPRINIVVKYWSSLLSLSIAQFGNPTLLKMKQVKKYENYDTYYGVLQLGVRRPGKLKYKVMGLIEALKCI